MHGFFYWQQQVVFSSHAFFFLLPSFNFENRTTNQWNNVKVEYVGFGGIYDLDLLKDEILE
jgi:hypothetical protein